MGRQEEVDSKQDILEFIMYRKLQRETTARGGWES